MKYFNILLLWCGYIVILFALNISIVQAANIEVSKMGVMHYLTIDGKIENGDFFKLMDKLSQIFFLCTAETKETLTNFKGEDPSAYERWINKHGEPKGLARITICLNSKGGNIAEAMKIGKVVRDMLLSTETGFCVDSRNKPDNKCMSACFFIWVAGVDRNAIFVEPRNPLGIHRLYFDSEYYKGLSSDKAEIEYKKVKNEAKKYLEEMGVPDYYFDKMLNIPSNEVYILAKEEVDNLKGRIPYYEQYLFSKCGSYTKKEEWDYHFCVMGIGKEYLQEDDYLSIINKCRSLSSGYLSYLKSKIQETENCWRVYGDIERWKRMNKYFSKKINDFE
jgi:hypothetical protein